MDLNVEKNNISFTIEQIKNHTKETIINQYIYLRKEKGYSQEKIAEITGIARPNIVRIERKTNMPSIEVLTKLAMALDMELEIKFVPKSNTRKEPDSNEQ